MSGPDPRGLLVVLSMLLAVPAFAQTETETNNSDATADTLTPGILMAGNLSSADDIDIFSLDAGASDALDIDFAAPASQPGGQWLLLIQRQVDGIIVYQEVLSPSANMPVSRNVALESGGIHLVRVQAAIGSEPPVDVYNLTVTPSNFQPAIGAISGVWQDPMDNNFYSIHENAEGLLYIELTAGLQWRAFFGARGDNRAVLDLVVGSGTATLELQFTSPTSYEARYLACQTAEQAVCAQANGELLYAANRVFSD